MSQNKTEANGKIKQLKKKFNQVNMISYSLFRSVRNQEKEMASSIMAAFLGIGLAFGSSLSLIIVQLL